jgi:hypothetical protein
MLKRHRIVCLVRDDDIASLTVFESHRVLPPLG